MKRLRVLRMVAALLAVVLFPTSFVNDLRYLSLLGGASLGACVYLSREIQKREEAAARSKGVL